MASAVLRDIRYPWYRLARGEAPPLIIAASQFIAHLSAIAISLMPLSGPGIPPPPSAPSLTERCRLSSGGEGHVRLQRATLKNGCPDSPGMIVARRKGWNVIKERFEGIRRTWASTSPSRPLHLPPPPTPRSYNERKLRLINVNDEQRESGPGERDLTRLRVRAPRLRTPSGRFCLRHSPIFDVDVFCLFLPLPVGITLHASDDPLVKL